MTLKRPYLSLLKLMLMAFVLSVIPLGETLLALSPFWLLLFYTFWLLHFSTRATFFIALMLGVFLDVLHGDVLGQSALALILSSVFIENVKQSFFVSNLSTQQVYVFISSVIYLATYLGIHFLVQGFSMNYYLLLAPVSSLLIWPVIRFFLVVRPR